MLRFLENIDLFRTYFNIPLIASCYEQENRLDIQLWDVEERRNPKRPRIHGLRNPYPRMETKNGGDDRDRTDDLYVANVPLSQLSYIPTYCYSLSAVRTQHPPSKK
jgi:hypothetical protein